NILIYCILLVPVLNFISNKKQKEGIISFLLQQPGGIFIFLIPIILEGHVLNLLRFNPDSYYGNFYNEYANTEHGLLLGFLWFLIGIVLTSQGEAFWE